MSTYVVNSIADHQKAFSDFNTPYDIIVETGSSKFYLVECKSVSREDFEAYSKQFISGSYALSTRFVWPTSTISFENNPKSPSDLIHEIAHLEKFLRWQVTGLDDNTLLNPNLYDFNRKVFRLASRLSYSPHFDQSLQESLRASGITINLHTSSSVFEPVSEVSQNSNLKIQSSSCQCYEWTDFQDAGNCEILTKSSTNSLKQLLHCISEILFVCIVSLFKNLIIVDIRLQYIANSIRNRISRNSDSYKKEPPIGGVKVGGDHLGSYVAEGFYSLSFST